MKRLIGLFAVIFIANMSPVFAGETSCKVGEKRANGGYVFYCLNEQEKDFAKITTGTKVTGLEAALKNIDQGLPWSEAIEACKNFREGGFSNWVLPTQRVFVFMYRNLHLKGVGAFGDDIFDEYWSSSEGSEDHAWIQSFFCGSDYYSIFPGGQFERGSGSAYYVRCVRAF